MSEHREVLVQLQEELKALKAEHGPRLHLQKHTAGSGPFPVTITVSILRPPAAANYDCEELKIRLQLDAAILEQRAASAGAEGINIQILSDSLPQRLRSHIAEELLHAWSASDKGPAGGFGLHRIFDAASADFVQLLRRPPGLNCIEQYETTDEHGATVRRYAVVNEDQQVSVDAALHVPPPEPPAASAPAAASSSPSRQPPRRPPVPGLRHPAAAGIAPQPATGAAVLKAELTWLQRRYGDGFRRQSDANAATEQSAPGNAGQFQLAFQPTDPQWDRGQLQLSISVSHSYPAAGSITVTAADVYSKEDTGKGGSRQATAQASQNEGLSADAAAVLAKLLTAEAAELAAAAKPLQSLVRSLDNSAAQHVQQAEDVAIEVARRRRLKDSCKGDGSSGAPATTAAPASHSQQHAQEQPDHGVDAGHAQAARRELPCANAAVSASQPAPPQKQGQVAVSASAAARRSFGDGLWWPSSGSSELNGVVADMALTQAQEHQPDANAATLSRSHSGTSEASHYSSGSGASDTASSEYDSDSDTDSSSDAAALGHAQLGQEAADRDAGSSAGARSALSLELLELSVDNVDIIEPHSLKVQTTCQRCRRPGEVALPASEATSKRIYVTAACSHCHHAWEVGVRAAMVHEHSVVLAKLWPVGFQPTDLLPSLLAVQCSNCSAVAAVRQVQVGQRAERNCSKCHRSMALQFAAVAFTACSGASSAAAMRAAQRAAHAQQQNGGLSGQQATPPSGFQLGMPLPDLGACKHYRHSHRWLRFPCCGQRFPCDLCHEEGTDGHEMKWATRMLCGHCSAEQPYGDRCCHCNKRLASSAVRGLSGRPTRFWEGGKGCRDRKHMDRRDAHKHRGSKAKTVSQKGKRVGKTAKERRERRAAAD